VQAQSGPILYAHMMLDEQGDLRGDNDQTVFFADYDPLKKVGPDVSALIETGVAQHGGKLVRVWLKLGVDRDRQISFHVTPAFPA